VHVVASKRRQTIQVISTNYTCHLVSSVSLGFSLGLRSAAPVAYETTPSTATKCRDCDVPQEVMQFLLFTLAFGVHFSALI
jgi:hypothetical protein